MSIKLVYNALFNKKIPECTLKADTLGRIQYKVIVIETSDTLVEASDSNSDVQIYLFVRHWFIFSHPSGSYSIFGKMPCLRILSFCIEQFNELNKENYVKQLFMTLIRFSKLFNERLFKFYSWGLYTVDRLSEFLCMECMES